MVLSNLKNDVNSLLTFGDMSFFADFALEAGGQYIESTFSKGECVKVSINGFETIFQTYKNGNIVTAANISLLPDDNSSFTLGVYKGGVLYRGVIFECKNDGGKIRIDGLEAYRIYTNNEDCARQMLNQDMVKALNEYNIFTLQIDNRGNLKVEVNKLLKSKEELMRLYEFCERFTSNFTKL